MTWVGTDQAIEWQARQESQRILVIVRGNSGKIKGEGYRNLWVLAGAGPRLKRVFLEQSITNTDERSHEALERHLQPVAQSLFGLDPSRNPRKQAFDLALRHQSMTDYQARLAVLVYLSNPKEFTKRIPHVAEQISTAMQEITDPEKLGTFGAALEGLGEWLPTEQAQAVALRLVEVMGTTTDWSQLRRLGETLGELIKQLPAEQVQTVALRLVQVMGTTADPDQLSQPSAALGNLGERLPAEQAKASALRLVEVMRQPITPNAFESLTAILGELPVTKDTDGIGTASNLLQAPMAFGETREQLLRYYSHLAGVFRTPEEFRTTDDLVAWVLAHRPSLDLRAHHRIRSGEAVQTGAVRPFGSAAVISTLYRQKLVVRTTHCACGTRLPAGPSANRCPVTRIRFGTWPSPPWASARLRRVGRQDAPVAFPTDPAVHRSSKKSRPGQGDP